MTLNIFVFYSVFTLGIPKMAPNSRSLNLTEESGLKPKDKVKEVLCDGYFYDVTKFIRRHPGGSIIEYYTEHGEDATLAIQQFHQRSPQKIATILSSFKKRKAEESESEFKSNFYKVSKIQY